MGLVSNGCRDDSEFVDIMYIWPVSQSIKREDAGVLQV